MRRGSDQQVVRFLACRRNQRHFHRGEAVAVHMVYVMLVKICNAYFELKFPIICCLSAMTHTTSNVFFDRLQREHLDVGLIASVFKRKQRVDDTDGDGAIQKSVRALKFLGLRVRSLHLLCKVHVAAGDRDDMTAHSSFENSIHSFVLMLVVSGQLQAILRSFQKCVALGGRYHQRPSAV